MISLFRKRARKSLGFSAATPAAAASTRPALPDGLLPINQSEPGDIFVTGYPKSGNTWVQYMLASVVYGLDLAHVPDQLVQDVIPCLHWRTTYRRYGSPMWFKSHALPAPHYRKVIYLVRDGRDVMVSYLHHLQALERKVHDFLHLVSSGEGLFLSKWHEHVRQWQTNPYGADIITVRYEDLHADPLRELQRMCQFAGLNRETTALQRAIEQARFGALREREKQLGWDNQHWPKDKPFVRRGAVGSYADEMPPEVLRAFLDEAADVLKAMGYSVT